MKGYENGLLKFGQGPRAQDGQPVAEYIPDDTKQRFANARQVGNDLVNDVPCLAEAAAAFGVAEAVAGAIAMSARLLFAIGTQAVQAIQQ